MDNHDEDRDGIFESILYFLGSFTVSIMQLVLLFVAIFCIWAVFDEYGKEIIAALSNANGWVGETLRHFFDSA